MFRIVLFTALLHECISDPRTPRIYNVLISSKKNLAPSQALPVYQPVLRATSVGLAFPPLYYTSLNPGQDHITEYEQSPPPSHQNELRQPNQPNTVEIQNRQNILSGNDDRYTYQGLQGPNPRENKVPQAGETLQTYQGPQGPSPSEDKVLQAGETFQAYQGLQEPTLSENKVPQAGETSQIENIQNNYQNYPPANGKGLPNNVIPLQQYFPYYPTSFNYQPFYPRHEQQKEELVNTEESSPPGNFEKIYDNSNPKQIVANFKRNPEIPDVPPPPLPVRAKFK